MTDQGPGPSRTRARVSYVAAAVVGVALLVAFAAPIHAELGYAIYPQDEGLLLVYPSLILHGGIPNRSFESVYGVANLWFIAAAFKVAGYSVTVERWVGILYRFVIVGSLSLLVWRHRGVLAAAVAGAISIILMVGTLGLAAYGWLGALALAGVAFVAMDVAVSVDPAPAKASGRLALTVAGVCLGLILGTRLDMGVSVVLVYAALVVTRRRWVPWLTLGVAVGLVPLLVNVVQAGPVAVIDDQIIQPIFVSGPARHLPLSTLNRSELALVALCVIVAVASVIFGVILARTHRDEWEPVLLLAVGAFEIGLLPQMFQRSDVSHLSQVGCFILPAALLLPAWRLRSVPWLAAMNWTTVVVGIVILVAARPFFGHLYWSEATSGNSGHDHYVSNDGRTVPIGSAADRTDLTVLLREVDARSHAGQRIFVGPLDLRTANYNDTYIYFLLPQLRTGSYYLEMNPGVANGAHSQLARDLRQDEFLILTSSYDDMADPDVSTRSGPNTPNQVVARLFVEVGARGPWVLYQRRK